MASLPSSPALGDPGGHGGHAPAGIRPPTQSRRSTPTRKRPAGLPGRANVTCYGT